MTDTAKGSFERQRWLAVLAHAERVALERHAAVLAEYSFELLRAPEIGSCHGALAHRRRG